MARNAPPPVQPPPVQSQNYGPPQVPPGYELKKKSHKIRWAFLGLLGLIVIIAIASSLGGSKTNNTPKNTPAPGTPGVSKGIGSQDASGDVKLGAFLYESTLSTGTVKVTVTNHSSKRSDYMITVALESADGKTQIDTADVFVQNLEPGQATTQEGMFLSVNPQPPATAKLVLKSVDRIAAS